MEHDFIYQHTTSLIQVLLQFIFFSKYTFKKINISELIFFVLLGDIAIHLPIVPFLKISTFAAILILYGNFLKKADLKFVILNTLLVMEIMFLCYGFFHSISCILAVFLYQLNPEVFALLFMYGSSILSLLSAYLCYRIIHKHNYKETIYQHCTSFIFIPLLMIFAISGYIDFTFYGNTIHIDSTFYLTFPNQVQILVIQTLAITSIFSMVYIYRKISHTSFLNQRLSILEKQTSFQQQYVVKAKHHYANTKALRHDIKNHILVLNTLLEQKYVSKAKTYIEDISPKIEGMSFPFHTNNPVLDILLEHNASLANKHGIKLKSSLHIPSHCTVSDVDFCTILSNALDNAVNACKRLGINQKKYIHISSKLHKTFLLIEIENSCNENETIKKGTGLNNIETIIKKHNGKMEIEKKDNVFPLTVLLVISQHESGSSHHIG